MTTVVLLGTLDTKGPEYAFLRQRVRAAGCDVIVVDAGVMSGTTGADVDADSVARAAGVDRGRLAAMRDRGPAVAAMTRGATAVVRRLHATGRLDGILGVGGSGGSSIVSAAMQALPLGVPKLRPDIEVVESAADINDPGFAQAMAGRPDELYWSRVEPRPAERREEVQGGRRITTAASAAS